MLESLEQVSTPMPGTSMMSLMMSLWAPSLRVIRLPVSDQSDRFPSWEPVIMEPVEAIVTVTA